MKRSRDFARAALGALALLIAGTSHDSAAMAPGPSFSCHEVAPDSVEALICSDSTLSALDRRLSGAYSAALRKARNRRAELMIEQRGWIEDRDECRNSEDRRGCVAHAYQRRTAELQARYRLVPGKGPVIFQCSGNLADQVVAIFFETDPPTMLAERAGDLSVMFLERSGSGAKYEGRNASFWEHQGEATITLGPGASEMKCRVKP
jgi:uncharacterized protein